VKHTPGGLRPLNDPLANVTVFMPLSSPRVLLSILAAASPLENLGDSCGLVRPLWEKKSGDVGWSLSVPAGGKVNWSSVCRGRA
jgi:hypothetical protein